MYILPVPVSRLLLVQPNSKQVSCKLLHLLACLTHHTIAPYPSDHHFGYRAGPPGWEGDIRPAPTRSARDGWGRARVSIALRVSILFRTTIGALIKSNELGTFNLLGKDLVARNLTWARRIYHGPLFPSTSKAPHHSSTLSSSIPNAHVERRIMVGPGHLPEGLLVRTGIFVCIFLVLFLFFFLGICVFWS